jgi:predicted metalloprotease with PDZ domain
MNPIRYSIVPKNPAAHLFEVTLSVPDPDPAGQCFRLPAWIPGSYMIREFARNIVVLRARNEAGRKVAIEKTDKHTWRAAPANGALTLVYEVYAWDLSVRAAHLDDTIGFFNGSSVFLAAAGREADACEIEIQPPAGDAGANWRVATALRAAAGTPRHGFGTYRAADYDELIDHPVTLGEFALGRFVACGVPHEIVISGRVPALDMGRLENDLQRICEAQIALFEPKTRQAPVERYVFMTLAVTDGYGGLEHRASTALICNRADLPTVGHAGTTAGYRTYLGLCSHEYFHTWNVKRNKPDAFAPYDLTQENYTRLLWLFEGFTSYYDDLMLVRSGLIGTADYFGLLGKTIGGVLRGAGRLKQSVADSSFDAWVKYYRQDENAANAIVSYYTKGSLVALAFDLSIRAQTAGRKSLDDVMRALWRRYGREFYTGRPRGIGEDDVLPLIAEATGADLGKLFADAVHGTRDLPLDALFAPLGLALQPEAGPDVPSMGARLRNGMQGHGPILATVFDGGPAQKAGLSAGDVLVALDGLRVITGSPEPLLGRYRPGDTVEVHVFRRDELRLFRLRLGPPETERYRLVESRQPGTAARKLRDAWLKR